MPEETFSSIFRNPHFSQLAALVSAPYRSLRWRKNHPELPFWTLLEACNKRLNEVSFANKNTRVEFISAFTALITSLVEADSRLFYRTEDMEWFADVMSGDRALVTMSMLFAAASSMQNYLTPVQVAEYTDTSESNWRNKAAAGEIVGAVKSGKQWLLPVVSLRAYGILQGEIPSTHYEEEDTESEM